MDKNGYPKIANIVSWIFLHCAIIGKTRVKKLNGWDTSLYMEQSQRSLSRWRYAYSVGIQFWCVDVIYLRRLRILYRLFPNGVKFQSLNIGCCLIDICMRKCMGTLKHCVQMYSKNGLLCMKMKCFVYYNYFVHSFFELVFIYSHKDWCLSWWTLVVRFGFLSTQYKYKIYPLFKLILSFLWYTWAVWIAWIFWLGFNLSLDTYSI